MNRIIPFVVSIVLISCKTAKVSTVESEIFRILNKINYQHQEITDEDSGYYYTISDLLNENEISKLETWKSPEPTLKNFYYVDCIGCTNDIRRMTPVYKARIGGFIHFGLEKSMGIENLTFNKDGTFVTHFFTFQGTPISQIEEEMESRKDYGYSIETIYPTKIEADEVYLEHKEYDSDQNNNGDGYSTASPMKIDYLINLKEKAPVLRFKFDGGFYSSPKMVHFFEPELVPNATDVSKLSSYHATVQGYYGEATFFLISLEDKMSVSVEIKSKVKDKKFEFSILKNDQFYTTDEVLYKKSKLYTQYQKKLKKGDYLIRVVNENSGYWDAPLFELHISKTKIVTTPEF